MQVGQHDRVRQGEQADQRPGRQGITSAGSLTSAAYVYGIHGSALDTLTLRRLCPHRIVELKYVITC